MYYKKDENIIRLSDGDKIHINEHNVYYLEYLAWLNAGNLDDGSSTATSEHKNVRIAKLNKIAKRYIETNYDADKWKDIVEDYLYAKETAAANFEIKKQNFLDMVIFIEDCRTQASAVRTEIDNSTTVASLYDISINIFN